MAFKNRTQLKGYFKKNQIPTEGQFADLIDSQLNQAQDGIFKRDGEPLSVVAAPGTQKRALRLYSDYPSDNPDWQIALHPAQDPGDAATAAPGFGIADGTGKPHFFIDPSGNVGIGTNKPTSTLHVTGDAGVLNLEGKTHAYIQWFPTGPDQRTGWIGYGSGERPNELGVWNQKGPLNLFGNAGVFSKTHLTVVGNLDVKGKDVSVFGRHAFRGTDTWLVLNQDGAFSQGVHTPGNLTSGALNVGAATSPGRGNAMIMGNLEIGGSAILGYAQRTDTLNGVLRSGFYEGNNPVGKLPDTAHDWVHLIAVRHSNKGNHHQLQIASTYRENDRLFFRKIARSSSDNGRPAWNELATVTNGVLRIGDWKLHAVGNQLWIEYGAKTVARFSTSYDRFNVFKNLDGKGPYIYYNGSGEFEKAGDGATPV